MLGEMTLVVRLLLLVCVMGSGIPAAEAASPSEDGFVFSSWSEWSAPEALEAVADAKRVGARHMSMMIRLCQDGLQASDVHWCDEDPRMPFATTRQGLAIARVALDLKRRGMTLGLLPIISCGEGLNRAWISPNDRPAWYQSYGDRITEIGTYARLLNATSLVVASELSVLFLEQDPWREVIRRVRAVYSGHLTASPVFAQFELIRFWDALDSIGVSAYFPLAANDRKFSNRQVALDLAWAGYKVALEGFARARGKKLTFVEVGYPNTNVAASRPWDYEWENRRTDFEAARKAWEAFRVTWSRSEMLRSFQIWSLTTPSTDRAQPKLFSPLHKPAEAVVRRLFAERAGK